MYLRIFLLLFAANLLFARNLKSKIPDGRIIGGEETSIESLPWQVSLQIRGRHFCGGAIYSKDIILTAAHCVYRKLLKYLSVRAGSSQHNIGGFVIGVSAIALHEKFSKKFLTNDVAVVLLSSSQQFSDRIQAISLATIAPKAESSAIVSGWGKTEKYDKSEYLQFAHVDIVAHEECLKAYQLEESITEATICAASVGKDGCQGDSGGPLVQNGQLIGIISWAHGCAHPKYPGVYANIAVLRNWIVQAAAALCSRYDLNTKTWNK